MRCGVVPQGNIGLIFSDILDTTHSLKYYTFSPLNKWNMTNINCKEIPQNHTKIMKNDTTIHFNIVGSITKPFQNFKHKAHKQIEYVEWK
jgi:hypothetical protein